MIGRGPAGAGNTSVQKGQPGPRLLQAGQARFGAVDAERLSVQGTVHWRFNTPSINPLGFSGLTEYKCY